MTIDVERNNSGKIKITKNETETGFVSLSTYDERYTMQDFSYVNNINFTSLQNAVNAQDYILGKYNEIVQNVNEEILSDAPNQTLVEDFLSNIANLINADENNLAGQRLKMEKMKTEMELIDEINASQLDEIDVLNMQLESANNTIEQKEKEIEELRKTILDITSITTGVQ
jgi:hypothetical protein